MSAEDDAARKRRQEIDNREHDRKVNARAWATARRQAEADRLMEEGIDTIIDRYKLVS